MASSYDIHMMQSCTCYLSFLQISYTIGMTNKKRNREPFQYCHRTLEYIFSCQILERKLRHLSSVQYDQAIEPHPISASLSFSANSGFWVGIKLLTDKWTRISQYMFMPRIRINILLPDTPTQTSLARGFVLYHLCQCGRTRK